MGADRPAFVSRVMGGLGVLLGFGTVAGCRRKIGAGRKVGVSRPGCGWIGDERLGSGAAVPFTGIGAVGAAMRTPRSTDGPDDGSERC